MCETETVFVYLGIYGERVISTGDCQVNKEKIKWLGIVALIVYWLVHCSAYYPATQHPNTTETQLLD